MLDHSALVPEEEISHLIYDAVKDQPYISVPKTSEFKSGPKVVKMVLMYVCIVYFYCTIGPLWRLHFRRQVLLCLFYLFLFLDVYTECVEFANSQARLGIARGIFGK